MTAPADIIAEARKWLGAPFHHAGRSRNGVDCAGLVIEVARALGVATIPDRPHYHVYKRVGPKRANYHKHDGVVLELECDKYMDEVTWPEVGTVGLFWFLKDRPQHVGFFGDYKGGGLSLIHTHSGINKVSEHAYAEDWPEKLVKIYRLRGVTY